MRTGVPPSGIEQPNVSPESPSINHLTKDLSTKLNVTLRPFVFFHCHLRFR